MTNLPHASVRDLEIFYPTNKLRAGTYGRGVWETDLNSETLGIQNFADVIKDNSVKIFSNSNEDLQISSNVNIVSIVIFDVLGKKVFEEEDINSMIFTVNAIRKNQNVYFVKTTLSDKTIAISKIVF